MRRNISTQIPCYILIIYLLATSVPAQGKAFLDRESILQAWQSNYPYNLNNVSIEYSEILIEQDFAELEDPQSGLAAVPYLHSKGVSDYTSKRHKWHVSNSESGFEDYDSVRRYAFDGQNVSWYQTNRNLGLIEKGLAGRSIEENTDIRQYLLMARSGRVSEQYPQGMPHFISRFSRLSMTVLEDMETISGIPCHVLFVDERVENIQYKVWVAHEKGMLPMKFQWYYNGQLREEIIVDKVGVVDTSVGSIWYPKEARRTISRRYSGRTTRRLHVYSIDFNVALDDSDFRINFPNGTRVIDRVAGLEYVVGVDRVDEVAPVYHIESDAQNAGDSQPLRRQEDLNESTSLVQAQADEIIDTEPIAGINPAEPVQANARQAGTRMLIWAIIFIAAGIALGLLIKANRNRGLRNGE